MKKMKVIALLSLAVMLMVACADKRSPGRIYMPDMAYSRAYEANAEQNFKATDIHYNPTPVAGTVRRGDLFPYTLTNDSTGYNLSGQVKNPLPPLDSVSMLEAQRLFSIYCAICHGPNMDAQGPLAGKVGGIANLKSGAYLTMPEGRIFHVTTYGKGNMGSYASQLDKRQRWMIVQYVKLQQNMSMSTNAAAGSAGNSPVAGGSGKSGADSSTSATGASAATGGTK